MTKKPAPPEHQPDAADYTAVKAPADPPKVSKKELDAMRARERARQRSGTED